MSKFKKYSAAILLIFALFAINGSEFLHHHEHCEDAAKPAKCDACILINSVNHSIVESVQTFTPHFTSEFSLQNSEVPLFNPEQKNDLNSRAPPKV
ncbi:MAG: hypothetical protein IAE93_13510 [Ignavibacteria bacterium]|nr:hypothetical protein [Ignavibacteria bacterium]